MKIQTIVKSLANPNNFAKLSDKLGRKVRESTVDQLFKVLATPKRKAKYALTVSQGKKTFLLADTRSTKEAVLVRRRVRALTRKGKVKGVRFKIAAQ